MDVLRLLDRCIALERAAGQVYEALAHRQADDAELYALWRALAGDERLHAQTLQDYRAWLRERPAYDCLSATGFDATVGELERLMAATQAAAVQVASADDAFRLALALELSELDAVYDELVRSGPATRVRASADVTPEHHARLVAAVRRRSQDEHNRLCAALLGAREA